MAGLWDARFTSHRIECIMWSFQQASYNSNYQQMILVLSDNTTYKTLIKDTLHSAEHKNTLLIRKSTAGRCYPTALPTWFNSMKAARSPETTKGKSPTQANYQHD